MPHRSARALVVPCLALVAVLGSIGAGTAVAQQGGAPLSLSPAPALPPPAGITTPRAAPGAPAGTAAGAGTRTPAPTAGEMTSEQMLQRVNASLNGMATLISDFRQVSPDGKPYSGKLYLQRPGKLRFEYDSPAPYLIIADGRNVAVLDRKLGTRDLYGINQTPLKFLTADRIDIARDAKLVSIGREGSQIVAVIEDKNTVAGTSRIKLWFGGGDTLVLQRWLVTDPQGYDTQVVLSNLDLGRRPENRQFIIDLGVGIRD